jgi:magnesium-transporting ATPase (P-type)
MKKLFKQKYFVIMVLVIFVLPVAGVFVSNVPKLQLFAPPHTFFGLDSLKDFFTF